MKKRRTLIISLLLIAALALGVGYAAVTATHLYIDGVARVDPLQGNLQVEFTAATPDASGLVTGSYNPSNPTEATIDATSFTEGGQTGSITYTIENKGVYDANVKVDEILPAHATGEYFHVTTELPDDTDSDGTVLLEAGDTMTVVVSVELVTTPLEMKEANIKITLSATPLETAP